MTTTLTFTDRPAHKGYCGDAVRKGTMVSRNPIDPLVFGDRATENLGAALARRTDDEWARNVRALVEAHVAREQVADLVHAEMESRVANDRLRVFPNKVLPMSKEEAALRSSIGAAVIVFMFLAIVVGVARLCGGLKP